MPSRLFASSVRRSLQTRLSDGNWICSSCRWRPIALQRSLSTASTPDKPYYVTSPIFYVNAAPHIGHLYCLVLCDILKRWQQLKGRRAIFSTGTDEHGMKVQRAAVKAETDPQAFCDKGADVFRDLAARAGIDYDHFVRTTDKDHKEAVEVAWARLERLGHIYEGKHEGWYSVTDETFYPESGVHLVLEPSSGRKMMASIETGSEVEWTSESNWKFRLSNFRDPLLKFYEDNPSWIYPSTRMLWVKNEVKHHLQDLSISRPSSRLNWGIPVPDDPSQTIYVWLDALINYLTKAGYPFTPGREHIGGWPADVHVIGKDITRFHCIYWPAFLMALKLPLPKNVLTHAHWTLAHQKMSKSVGNVVNPFFAIDRFGKEAMRFYLAHDGGLEKDNDYSNYHIIERYKKCLQGGLGNLASRIIRGKGWSVRNAVYNCVNSLGQGELSEVFGQGDHGRLHSHAGQIERLMHITKRVEQRMEVNDIPNAVKDIMEIIFETNRYVAEMKPWAISPPPPRRPETSGGQPPEWKTLNEDEQRTLDATIYLSAEALRISGILLSPIMPMRMAKLLDMLGVEESHRTFEYATLGADDRYGTPFVNPGKGIEGTLFPPLTSDA